MSTVFKRETLYGEFLQVNSYLVAELKRRGLWMPTIREKIKRADGSVPGIDALPEDIRALYRTAWELPQRALIDMAAARTLYIDQSQSTRGLSPDGWCSPVRGGPTGRRFPEQPRLTLAGRPHQLRIGL